MDLQEHLSKETLKRMVDKSPNYTDTMRFELKAIIDAARTPEELMQAVFAYFAGFRW